MSNQSELQQQSTTCVKVAPVPDCDVKHRWLYQWLYLLVGLVRVLKDYGILFFCKDERDRRLCVQDILRELGVEMKDTGNYLCMRTTRVNIIQDFSDWGLTNPTGAQTYYFATFCRYLYENEEHWTGEGEGYVQNFNM